jgi:hypothetical protein
MTTIPRLAASADALVAGATERRIVHPGDARSGSTFERVVIDGVTYFLKTISADLDWMMRVTGDRDLRTYQAWAAGLMDGAAERIDPAVVGMAREGVDPHGVLSILMRDVGDSLIPEGDDPITVEQADQFMTDLATLCTWWSGWTDSLGLMSMEERLNFFAPAQMAPEAAVDDPPVAVAAAARGWKELPSRAPELAEFAASVHAAPSTLADALRSGPQCLLQGDWKMGNLGVGPDGRTILLDWAYPGAGPPCWDLCWYLALNRARLPRSKEDTIEAFRRGLSTAGMEVRGWFDEQLDLCMAGMMVTFGWEKALGDEEELRWWAERARRGVARL